MLIKFGIMIAAWVAIISGIVGALAGGFAVLAGAFLDAQAHAVLSSAEGISGMALVVIGLFFAIAGVAQIIFGIGLWQLRGWAWTLGVALETITLLGSLGGLFTGAFTVQSIINIIISGGILAYLLTPRVRKLFGRRNAQVANS
jgi:uncharacterized membrane protein (DUF2068 family)